jgi:hypothetical protein
MAWNVQEMRNEEYHIDMWIYRRRFYEQLVKNKKPAELLRAERYTGYPTMYREKPEPHVIEHIDFKSLVEIERLQEKYPLTIVKDYTITEELKKKNDRNTK